MKLIPNESVGGMKFGRRIKDYLAKYDFQITYHIENEIPEWDNYKLVKEGVEVKVENGIIEAIAARKQLYYKGKNLIGQSLESLEKIIDMNYDEIDEVFLGEEEVPHKVYEYYSLGLQVWVKDSIVDCIYCDANCE